MNKQLYSYQGAVKHFDTLVANNWCGTTYAGSEKQAASNLAYQFKKSAGYAPSTKISLCGKPQLTVSV